MITRCPHCGMDYDAEKYPDCPACAGGFAASPIVPSDRPAATWRESEPEGDDDPFPQPTESDLRTVRRLSVLFLFLGWANTADLVASWLHLMYDLEETAPHEVEKMVACTFLGLLTILFLPAILFLFIAAPKVRRIEGRGIAIAACALAVVMAGLEMLTVFLGMLGEHQPLSAGAELRRSLNFLLSSLNAALTASLSVTIFVILLGRSMTGLFWIEARRRQYRQER